MDSVSSLGQWILLLPLKGTSLLTACSKEVALFSSGPGEWLKGVKGQMDPGRTESFDVWLVIELQVDAFWCLWAEWSLAGQTQSEQSNSDDTLWTLRTDILSKDSANACVCILYMLLSSTHTFLVNKEDEEGVKQFAQLLEIRGLFHRFVLHLTLQKTRRKSVRIP